MRPGVADLRLTLTVRQGGPTGPILRSNTRTAVVGYGPRYSAQLGPVHFDDAEDPVYIEADVEVLSVEEDA